MFDEDPLDRFRRRALALARQMRFDPFLVNEAIATLTGSLGPEWVVCRADTKQRGTPWPFRDHPVGQMIHVAGESQVAAALELAHYLKTAAGSPSFATVVAQIKARDETQYRHTLLQLAFRYRFALLADEPPILEPLVEGGRVSDIQFHRLDRPYVVECYAPDTSAPESDEVHWLTVKTLDAIAHLDGVFSIAVQFHALPTAAERKRLHARVVATANELDLVDWHYGMPPPSEMIELDVARVSVSRTLPGRPGGQAQLSLHPSLPDLGDPHRFVGTSKVPMSALKGLDPTAIQAPRLSHVVVWLPGDHARLSEYVDKQVLRLVRKLKRKLGQTRSGNAHRVLVVETWTAHSRFRLSEEAQARVEHAIFDGHSNVAGVLLVTRYFDQHLKRHRYQMRPLVNVAVGGSPIVDLRAHETSLTVPPVLS